MIVIENTFLIEIRLARTRWKVKKTSFEIARRYDVLHCMERHPHITLYGPFTLNDSVSPDIITETIEKIARQYDTIPFVIGAWEKRDGMHGSVIASSVTSSGTLQKITREISTAFLPVSTSLNTWDQDIGNKWYHVTIANMLPSKKADAILSGLNRTNNEEVAVKKSLHYLHRKICSLIHHMPFSGDKLPISPFNLDDAGLRITVMNGDRIFGEYDLLQKKWLSEKEILQEESWQQSMALFRRYAGFECFDPVPAQPDDIFLIGDLHLGHANIIRYCSRPFVFPDSAEMDHVLIKNWNYTISSNNRVYHLGDLCYGEHALPAKEYQKKLKGDSVFIKGNHDEPDEISIPHVELEYEGYRFLLIHDPAQAPRNFDGWIIHAHHHNNDLTTFPFIRFQDKHINVSAEVTGYVPVSLRELVQIIKTREASGNSEPLPVRYPYNT